MAKRKNKMSQQRADLTAVRGLARAEHYANGGTPQMYRGASRTLDNKTKARAQKQACRGRVHRDGW
jgi:hypothetical protein